MEEGPGANIAVLRKAANLTQRGLATRAQISHSLLTKIETGDRAATHAVIAAIARALRVAPERLLGQPYPDAPHPDAVEALRTAVRRYDLPNEPETTPRTLAELGREVAGATQLRRDARYGKLAHVLPPLIEELTYAAHSLRGEEQLTAWRLLADSYGSAHTWAHRLGYADLAEMIADRLSYTAMMADDQVLSAVAAWTRVNAFQAAGDYSHGLHVLDRASQKLTPDNERAAVVLGSLHLRGMTLASRAKNTSEANAQFRQAEHLANLLPGDTTHHHLTFGPANTLIHQVAARVELERPRDAINLAERFTAPKDLPATRHGHHYIDVARAYLVAGDRDRTMKALRQAKQVAPEQTRYHPMVRETTRVLVSMHRRANADLVGFATWLGVAG